MARAKKASQGQRTVLVTGGNRGLGLEVCRSLGVAGMRVILAARDPKQGEQAAHGLRKEGLDVHVAELDVSREESIERCARELRYGEVHVDVLINNAALYPPGGVLETSSQVWLETMAANVNGAFWMCKAFVPAMVKAGYGRVVNVSSSSGSFGEDLDGPAAYCVSKAALNALTVKLAQELHHLPDLKVNAVCPGWVRTRMGGDGATRGFEEGAEGIVWLATLPSDGPTGSFFRDREWIPW